MTRLLCTADFHLHEWPGLAPVDRLADQALVLGRIIEVATEREVDAVLIAGDVFHRPNPTPRTLNVFREFARELVYTHKIDVLAITGNASHDIENGDRFCALELFDDLIDVRRGPGTWTGSGVDAICLPSVPMSNLVARTNGGDRDEIHAEAAQMLLDVIEAELGHHRAMTSARGHELPVVVLGHWHVDQATTSNGARASDFFHEPLLPLYELAALPVDAVVLGHNHRGQLLNGTPPILHPGSPYPLDHGEAGYDHGVSIIEVELGALTTEFVPLESRRFVTLDLESTELLDPGVGIGFDGWEIPEGAIVRARYTTSAEDARRIDVSAIRRALTEQGAALVRIQPEIVRADRARVEGLDEQLGELDAVELWNVAQGVEPAHGVELVDLTRGYLETTVQS